MQVILGIGNPGRDYDGTRHNLGFAVVDALARQHGCAWALEKRFRADIATWESPGGRVLLVKPRTFVNVSGETAQGLLAFHKLPPTNLLVLVDDLNLATGHLRLRADGSAGGHNGLKDIEARLGQAYPRLRLGCGPIPAGADQIGFVLTGFPPHERDTVSHMIAKAAAAATAWLSDGVAVACRFNGPLVAKLPSGGAAERRSGGNRKPQADPAASPPANPVSAPPPQSPVDPPGTP